ncbi:M48 family metallopeptidase [Deinococcus altitudinis]|uniref:M48 family metallopeptidase n=1 Tax=Deinococcus altitudinis TaxID=468914 RepID=UPI0038921092
MTPPGSDRNDDLNFSDLTPGELSFAASYFDGLTSRDRPAEVQINGQTLLVRSEGLEASYPLKGVRIESPLSRLRRVLKLPGGARLETDDRRAIAALERRMGRNAGLGLVQRLESNWPVALASVVGVLAFLGLFVQYGLPALAGVGAQITPVAVMTALDAQTVRAIDGEYLSASSLNPARQNALRREFAALAAEQGGPYTFRLLFRDGGDLVGANAFALPGGTVFVTDELVKLAQNDREILGVLAHEVGHVEHRHAMRQIYQSLGLTLAFSVVAGDVTSAASVAAAVPALLLNSGYSRQAETQADDDAGRWLMKHYGTTRPLQDILKRLIEQDGPEGKSSVLDMLASHPGEGQRLAHLRAIEAQAEGKR